MHIFLVIFEEAIASEAKEQAASDALPMESFLLSEYALLVGSPVSSPGHLRDLFGLSDESSPTNVGVVFRLNGSYAGYYDAEIWDWLQKAREESG